MSRAEGFAAVPNWMIRDRSVPRNAILVYASLSSRAGMGAIFPSQATIAEEAGLSERTVRTMLGKLEQIGVIERRSRRGSEGRSNSKTDGYTLHPNGIVEEPANIAGRSERPANGGRATGNQQQLTLLIEVDREEVDKDSVAFDDFWSIWPRKDAKKAASAAWDRAVKRADAQTILDAANAYVASPNRPEKQYVPHAATWLNGDRWDDPLPERTGKLSTLDLGRAADALLTDRSGMRALS
ncbi:helix-turn-helix domain-containing protein [Microbacterium sp. PM5]|uniref:helix-turn-helix domain-containing protein n=1 Tax=Microbacterium sp. PM5 TaxID=2014534 RepID=UPI000DD0F14A|nr:helix-turn-helix domain-containing protein [Microbacterium sp. PM5]AXA95428.1 hypothetical protein CEP17_02790 [Microbacterium sp. PM5]